MLILGYYAVSLMIILLLKPNIFNQMTFNQISARYNLKKHVPNFGARSKCARTQKHSKKKISFSFKCPQRMDTKVIFLICVRPNLKSKSNLSLHLLYYAEACNGLAGPISTSLRLGNTASFEEMSQQFDRPEIRISNLPLQR